MHALNEAAGTRYRSSSARTRSYTPAGPRATASPDFLAVIDTMAAEWAGDPKMAKYLRPSTLFSPKFEDYVNRGPRTRKEADGYAEYDLSAPRCGARLEVRYVVLAGRRTFCGWKPCGCPGAVAERDERSRLEARAKAEEAAAKRRRAYERAGIEPRFMTAASPMAEGIAAKVEQGRGAYIRGPVGTGKTHLASAVARLLVDGGTSVRVTDMLGVLAAIKGTYGGDGTEDGVLSRLSRVGCLVLDDLGKRSPPPTGRWGRCSASWTGPSTRT